VNVLVTGAGGFVGRYLVAELHRRGHEVTGLVRRAPDRGPEMRCLTGDLRRTVAGLADQLARAEAIVHLAGGSGSSWRSTFDINVTATERLMEALAAAAWGGRLVHVSTIAVYAFNQLPARALVDESTPVEPDPGRRDDYAWSKLLQERLVRRAADRQVELVVVRPGAIYGAERRFQHRLGRLVGDGNLVMFGGGNLMPLNYVENTAALLAACVEHPAAGGETFNAIDPDEVRQWQYARAWRRLSGDAPTVIPLPRSALQASGRVLASAGRMTGGRLAAPGIIDPYLFTPAFGSFRYAPSRAITVLGWRPPVDLSEALRRTFTDPDPASTAGDRRRSRRRGRRRER
jgi:nucleoside-diphosphate-sugar epimerase